MIIAEMRINFSELRTWDFRGQVQLIHLGRCRCSIPVLMFLNMRHSCAVAMVPKLS